MRLILAGRDAVAVDTVEALIMNWDPQSVKYLVFLNKSGLGEYLSFSHQRARGKRWMRCGRISPGSGRPPAGTRSR